MKQMLESSVWRHRDLRLAAAGRSASFLGDEVATIALTLYAFDAGWGATGVAAVLVAAALPLALGAPLAGRLVDRVDSRRATTLAALWQGLCAAGAVVVLLVADPGSPATAAALLVLVAALGAGQAVSGPAWQALVPHLVPADEVPRAVALLQSTTTLAGVAGPAVGGLLVAGGGVAGALAVDAVSFGALALAARTVRTVRRPEPAAGRGGTWAGYALLRDDRLLGALVGGLVAMIVVLQVVVVLDVLLVREVLGAGPAGYGVVNALFAAAMVVGAVLAGRWCAPRAQVGVVVGSASVIAGLVVLGGLAPALGWFAAALAGIGFANGALNVAFGAFLAGRVPDAVRGRLFAAVTGATQSASIGGMALGGVVGGLVDVRAAWVGAGAAGLLVSAVVAVVVTGTAGRMTGAVTVESQVAASERRPAAGRARTGAPAREAEQRLAAS
jgi:MFS family permease